MTRLSGRHDNHGQFLTRWELVRRGCAPGIGRIGMTAGLTLRRGDVQHNYFSWQHLEIL
jgi:hypothetical protein